ncbi:MAG: DUF2497 domain-containing protein [Phycisphaerales bacterium]|nr:DUF2497 domain-containing protein [Hyphomonadaceae bacterium]
MALQEPQAEPSMEEILASIRRIISEEEQPQPPVLDLTQTDEPQMTAAPHVMVEDDDIVFEAVEHVVVEAPPAPQAAPVLVQQRVEVSPAIGDDIVSAPSANATANALARLSGTLRIADTQNQTIEGVIRELLKPMLKEWLDKNLPAIVDARVEAELERISRLAR